MQQVYRHNQTTNFLIKYHFVWAVRRRNPVLKGMVAIRLEELIHEICKKLEIKVLILEIKPNYVHVFLDCPPTLSPHQVIHRLKGYSARHLRQEFEQLLVLPSMWTRFYLVSTEEIVSHETIKDYLKNKSQKA